MRTFTTILTAMALGGGLLAAAAPASAASRDGVCDSGEFCYYFNSDNQGSVSDFTASVADYATTQPTCYDFKGPGAGKGECIKNAAASVWNRSSKTVRVYYNTGYAGTYQDFAAGAKGNLNATLKNQNASHEFGPSSSSRSNMSYSLYTASGTITCGFDGYTSTEGRHEGIDIARGVGSNVHALVAGEVINVVRGATGRANLSTIAIYNAAANKTVIYLHSAPLSSLRVGQQVTRGQVIATESWHGVSSRASAHTHVEMRPGRQTRAAKSVGDPHLDNPNPTSFWNSQGYNVR
ncbi:peptidoglycan DD-metalloendopeptidase family protein [Nonomuraea sp. FMUSA5-5]|uniref:Peptidoglycan DD-metalloendopeptidase family protein n=1 Tax=Nonomuraea composti TaxID=2720023 RepID=A0ABX1BJN6_9ACTN|nr:peptidase inhibitor family I36 protein [Nonomuraea sp. FMUSA5-5]NJP95511.1 peptidoglycan DD-metalloendopeptidase family protein [Nonomuraea sp. FMUSA5-5]